MAKKKNHNKKKKKQPQTSSSSNGDLSAPKAENDIQETEEERAELEEEVVQEPVQGQDVLQATKLESPEATPVSALPFLLEKPSYEKEEEHNEEEDAFSEALIDDHYIDRLIEFDKSRSEMSDAESQIRLEHDTGPSEHILDLLMSGDENVLASNFGTEKTFLPPLDLRNGLTDLEILQALNAKPNSSSKDIIFLNPEDEEYGWNSDEDLSFPQPTNIKVEDQEGKSTSPSLHPIPIEDPLLIGQGQTLRDSDIKASPQEMPPSLGTQTQAQTQVQEFPSETNTLTSLGDLKSEMKADIKHVDQENAENTALAQTKYNPLIIPMTLHVEGHGASPEASIERDFLVHSNESEGDDNDENEALKALLAEEVHSVTHDQVSHGDDDVLMSYQQFEFDLDESNLEGYGHLHPPAEHEEAPQYQSEVGFEADEETSKESKVHVWSAVPHARDDIVLAADRGDLASVLRFLELDVDPNDVTHSGLTALHAAVVDDHADIVYALLEHNANVNAALPYCEWTPLHKAAARGSIRCAELLLQYGADPCLPKSDGLTSIDLAEKNERTEMVRFLKNYLQSSYHTQPRVMSLKNMCACMVRRALLAHPPRALLELDLSDPLKRYIVFGKLLPESEDAFDEHVSEDEHEQVDLSTTPPPPRGEEERTSWWSSWPLALAVGGMVGGMIGAWVWNRRRVHFA